MKAQEIRELTDEELGQQLLDKQDALFNFRMQMATGGALDNVRAVRNVRREIARIRTVMRERQLATQEEPQSTKKRK